MRIAKDWGYYDLEPLPGNPQVCVSTHLMTYPTYRHRGEGAGRLQDRMDEARTMGYRFIMATVRADNEAEKRLLSRECWGLMNTFRNHDDDEIQVWGRAL